MRSFFDPKSVAVVGISDRPNNLARAIVNNLHVFSFDGIVYLVGHRGGVQFGRRIFKSVSDIPDQVDLAVILTPAPTVPEILKECGLKGIKRVIIETAGFREFGGKGLELEQRIVETAGEHDMRIIGPNGIGVMNLHNGLVLPFTPFEDIFTRGSISIISQSGGVGITYLNLLASENLGIAKFASVGNKLDVDENDLLEYLLQDEQTEIICLYLEGISDGRRLMEIAKKATKPILLQKSGIGNLSRSIAASHTAALATDDSIVDAALRQAGIARFRDSDTLINYLKVLPLPPLRGNRLAVISRSGGHAVQAADACELAGFELAHLPQEFVSEVEKHFRAHVVRLTNPLDLGDLFDYDIYMKIVRETLAQPGVDGLVFLHTYVSRTEGPQSHELFDRLTHLPHEFQKPVVTCIATDGVELSILRKRFKLPIFTDPQAPVNALRLSRDFRGGVSKDEPAHSELLFDTRSVIRIIAECREERRNPTLKESLTILSAYGLPVIPFVLVSDAEEAVEAAKTLGFPVALKVVSEQISHKSDVGGVQLNLRTGDGVRTAYAEMIERIVEHSPDAHIQSVLVQPMAQPGFELILGGKQDSNFGPWVLVGMGGIFTEVLSDISRRIAPLSPGMARQMIEALKASPILKGARGQRPRDIDSVVDALLRLGRLLIDFPEILEIDVNPFRVFVAGQKAMALDGRIILDRSQD